MQGVSDFTALAGRAGELNGFLNHETLAEKPWIKALTEPAQLTLNVLAYVAKGAGKTALENIQLAFLPVDSRLSKGAMGDSAALMLRNLVMGHVLLSHPEKMQINEDFAKRHAAWRADLKKGRDLYQTAQHRWLYQAKEYDRRATAKLMQDIQHELKRHLLNEPKPFDYHSKRYAEAMQNKISNFFARNGQLTQEWTHQAKAWSTEHGLNAAAITWGIAAINLFNTMITYEIASRDGELSKKDWAKIGSAAAYTGNALMAVFVETGWGAMKDLSIPGKDSKPIKITHQSAAQWRAMGKPGWGKLLNAFGSRLVGLGGFAVVAAALELWDIGDDYASTDVSLDKSVILIKKYSVIGFLIIGGIQVSAGVALLLGSGAMAALVMSPWFLGVTALIGFVYLLSTLTLNYLKRDLVGSWLHKCRWSRYWEERFKSEIEENQTFHEIQLAPAVFVKPTFEIKHRYSPSVGSLSKETQSGAWVQLLLPGAVCGELIKLNVAATGRPFAGFPVEKMGGSLNDYFTGYGTVEAVSQWRNTPPSKTQMRWNEPPKKSSPTEDEVVIWQTWVPLDEDVQYLELQVWYAPETIAIREGDKGFRFQVELAKGGQTDNSESRVVGTNKGSLEVETLGGRDEAVTLPIPT